MIQTVQSKRARYSVIFHFSRPIKLFLQRFSVVALVTIALFSIIISKLDSPFANQVKSTVSDIFAPALLIISTPAKVVANWGNNMDDYLFVYKKNKALMLENRTLEKELIRLSQVAVENERLKTLLNFTEDLDYSFTSAVVVGDTSGPFMRSILLNVNQSQHIKKGEAVIGDQGLVGRIIEVGSKSARVLLITDINSKIPVISSISRQRSIMKGDNSATPSLLYLPKEHALEKGEAILTSGDGQLFPPNLVIGKVFRDGDDRLKVRPFMQWHRLDLLSVVHYGHENSQQHTLKLSADSSQANSTFE